MKSTGIVRKIDELGRIVLPIEIRNTLDIKAKDWTCFILACSIYTILCDRCIDLV